MNSATMLSKIARRSFHSSSHLPLQGHRWSGYAVTPTRVLVSNMHTASSNDKSPHVVYNKEAAVEYEKNDHKAGDHVGRQQNHIWDQNEIKERFDTLYRHQPKSMSDKFMNTLMYGMYHGFNFMTGYQPVNTSVRAMEWRLIVLESIAGVPGFVAAGFRHFRSLRRLQRDHGWIATLLEEAENERMHLLICLKMFNASFVTRALVISAQLCMTPYLMLTYAIHPPAMHRFVGYLEETACMTYANVIQQVETPGTELHKHWGSLPAPDIAKAYWRLPADASFADTLKCMFADECHHRDVNHTFADMKAEEPSPFVSQHRENALRAWELDQAGKTAWPARNADGSAVTNNNAPTGTKGTDKK